ncbi:MAG TPA: potassium transporter TrkA [Anaerolineae bacterium]|nr:potassium transporter TrkA [Anaerolineae bacterium]
MAISQEQIIFITAFIVIALASWRIGEFLTRFKLPLISGYLFAGIVVGPFGLNLITEESLGSLRVIDELSLAVIAFAAGSELYLRELRQARKSIAWVTAGNMVVIPILGGITVFLLASYMPFLADLPLAVRIAAAVLVGPIMVARSPSSVIAIVNELRAKGPFTQTVVGVTMVIDVLVILLFALSTEMADALINNVSLSLTFVGFLLFELAISLMLGVLTGKLLQLILSRNVHQLIKITFILALGLGVFLFSTAVRDFTHDQFPLELLLEPLLICLIGSFYVINYTTYRLEFLQILHDVSPAIYVIFFTLTGAALQLDVLAQAWTIALALFLVRMAGIFLGSFSGGAIAGAPMKHNRVSWMAYMTQAGVGLGLAKEIGIEFPVLGADFATMIIAMIVFSQFVGPPLFKWAVNHVGESHTRAKPSEFDGVRDALIFGVKPQSLQLARQLQAHDWQVKLICRRVDELDGLDTVNLDCQASEKITLETLQNLNANQVDALVSFMPVEDSYRLCELAYENFGTETMVVYLKSREEAGRFEELGVRVVEPDTAVVKLLEQFVRSPAGTPILLGTDSGQEMMDIEVADHSLDNVAIRDLSLPLDVLILSIHRDGQTLVPHGYTELKLGDRITAVGPPEKLAEVSLQFET